MNKHYNFKNLDKINTLLNCCTTYFIHILFAYSPISPTGPIFLPQIIHNCFRIYCRFSVWLSLQEFHLYIYSCKNCLFQTSVFISNKIICQCTATTTETMSVVGVSKLNKLSHKRKGPLSVRHTTAFVTNVGHASGSKLQQFYQRNLPTKSCWEIQLHCVCIKFLPSLSRLHKQLQPSMQCLNKDKCVPVFWGCSYFYMMTKLLFVFSLRRGHTFSNWNQSASELWVIQWNVCTIVN